MRYLRIAGSADLRMPRPRVVLDTNVIVSAHLKDEGLERFVLDLALAHKLHLYLSAEILEEYKGVLARPAFKLDSVKVAASLRLMEKAAIMVRPAKKVNAAKDLDDNKFLECAEEAQADYLVTGNKKHFPQQGRQTRIVNARELLQEIMPDLQR
ncbi:MAG TPA: putative toxin-antitoxin system toxin component, PIN family [Candidatus Angelobacter sp.]